MRKVPAWSVRIQAKMLESGITKKQLAENLNCNYNQLVNVMSGLISNDKIETDIKNYFKKKEEKKNVR